jgi:hypothetical protein
MPASIDKADIFSQFPISGETPKQRFFGLSTGLSSGMHLFLIGQG